MTSAGWDVQRVRTHSGTMDFARHALMMQGLDQPRAHSFNVILFVPAMLLVSCTAKLSLSVPLAAAGG